MSRRRRRSQYPSLIVSGDRGEHSERSGVGEDKGSAALMEAAEAGDRRCTAAGTASHVQATRVGVLRPGYTLDSGQRRQVSALC